MPTHRLSRTIHARRGTDRQRAGPYAAEGIRPPWVKHWPRVGRRRYWTPPGAEARTPRHSADRAPSFQQGVDDRNPRFRPSTYAPSPSPHVRPLTGPPRGERALIIRAKAGDPRAFDALVRAHASFAHNVALRTLGDAREAEDVTQEAFVRAWRALPRFREDGRFSTWLYRIVVNLCYDRAPRLRRRATAMPVDAAALLPDRRPSPEGAVAQRELRRAVSRAMDRLPDPYRMLLLCATSSSSPTPRSPRSPACRLAPSETGIHRGRKRLRVLLAEDGVAREGLQAEAALGGAAVQEAAS